MSKWSNFLLVCFVVIAVITVPRLAQSKAEFKSGPNEYPFTVTLKNTSKQTIYVHDLTWSKIRVGGKVLGNKDINCTTKNGKPTLVYGSKFQTIKPNKSKKIQCMTERGTAGFTVLVTFLFEVKSKKNIFGHITCTDWNLVKRGKDKGDMRVKNVFLERVNVRQLDMPDLEITLDDRLCDKFKRLNK